MVSRNVAENLLFIVLPQFVFPLSNKDMLKPRTEVYCSAIGVQFKPQAMEYLMKLCLRQIFSKSLVNYFSNFTNSANPILFPVSERMTVS